MKAHFSEITDSEIRKWLGKRYSNLKKCVKAGGWVFQDFGRRTYRGCMAKRFVTHEWAQMEALELMRNCAD